MIFNGVDHTLSINDPYTNLTGDRIYHDVEFFEPIENKNVGVLNTAHCGLSNVGSTEYKTSCDQITIPNGPMIFWSMMPIKLVTFYFIAYHS